MNNVPNLQLKVSDSESVGISQFGQEIIPCTPISQANFRKIHITTEEKQSVTQSATAAFCCGSHRAVIRVYDGAGNVIETHEHAGDFKDFDRGSI